MALVANDVSYTYGQGTGYSQQALSGVSLALEPGEVTLLLGHTGSGKSTLLRIMAGLMAPSVGSIGLDGRPVDSTIAGRPGGAGLVFQSPETQLFADTVLDDVSFGPRNQGREPLEVERAARLALAEVGLPVDDFKDRSPFALSGGEARRVALAGVLAMNPAYLLLDEPTAGLDESGREAVLAAIGRAREHSGIAIASHDVELFLPVSDRVLVLTEGHPTFSGSAADLVAEPRVLESTGLIAPDVLRVQMMLAHGGLNVGSYTLDPYEAARAIARAVGGGRR